MAGRQRTIPRRARIFLGCESKSEIALIVWLQKLCDTNDLPHSTWTEDPQRAAIR